MKILTNLTKNLTKYLTSIGTTTNDLYNSHMS